MLNKPLIPVRSTRPDDPRLGHLLAAPTLADHECRVVLIGFPVDEGVRRNGGRPGAASGPSAIRARLYSLTPDARSSESFLALLSRTRDLGDLVTTGNLESDQENLGRVLAPWISRGVSLVVLGGGHETAYGHFLGYVKAGRPVEIVNWDAHPDVRELRDGLGHSGSPFRQALCHPSGLCRRYTVAGLLPQAAARAHVDFIHEGGNRVFWRSDVTREMIADVYAGSEEAALAVSFDLDAVELSAAPGVSAPSVDGLPSGLWLEAAYQAGLTSRASSFDLCELNPRFDLDDRTARLAALTIWQILRGLAARSSIADFGLPIAD